MLVAKFLSTDCALKALLDGVTAAFYNAFFTAGPILCFALFDRPVRYFSTLMQHPQLYNIKPPLTTGTFWKTGVATAITHGAVSISFPCTPHSLLCLPSRLMQSVRACFFNQRPCPVTFLRPASSACMAGKFAF